jgi:hypothetical protein
VAAGLSPTLASRDGLVNEGRHHINGGSWRWRPVAVGSNDFLQFGGRRREVHGMGHWLPVSPLPLSQGASGSYGAGGVPVGSGGGFAPWWSF